MIAVPPDERAQSLLVPIVENQVEIKRSLLSMPAIKDLVQNQKSHLIGQFEQFGRWRIVACANRVAPHFAQYFKLPPGRRCVEGRAERSKIVMLIHAFEV